MRQKLLMAGLLVVAAGFIAILVNQHQINKRPRELGQPVPEESSALHPLLQTLLQESAKEDRDWKSPFFAALTELMQRNEKVLEEMSRHSFVDEGYAVEIKSGGRRYIVAVLRGDSGFRPGTDTEYLILFDQEGRFLDKVSCGISNRLTRMFVGTKDTFQTQIFEDQEHEPQLIIRYTPKEGGVSGNWSHAITYHGKAHTFHWDEDRTDANRSAEWDRNGLCRLAIRGHGFVIVFPDLGRSSGEN